MATNSRNDNSYGDSKPKRNQNPRNRQGKNTTNSRRAAPSTVSCNSNCTFQRRGYYEILVGNYGIKKLCNTICMKLDLSDEYFYCDINPEVFQMYREHTAYKSIRYHLIYVVLMCHALRCYIVSIHLGYNQEFNENMSRLFRILEHMELPSLICDYIEAIGRFELKNGITVVPWFAPKDEFYSSDLAQLTPEEVLGLAERSKPKNLWCIDYDWISRFNSELIFKSTLCRLRKISWNNVDGRMQMIMRTRDIDCNTPEVTSPQKSTQVDSWLGAIFNFRRFSEKQNWPAETRNICHDFFWLFADPDIIYLYVDEYYQIKIPGDSGFMMKKRSSYEIFTGNYGLEPLCKIVHNAMFPHYEKMFDPSLDQLIYVMIMCHFIRCSYHQGLSEPQWRIANILKRLELPSILCKYIEAIGRFELKNCVEVIPWSGPIAEFYSEKLGQLTPEEVLKRAGRPIPEENRECIDSEWILDFFLALPELNYENSPPWLQLRKINWEDKTGSIEMLITTTVQPDSKDTPVATCPEKCSELEAQRGGLFNYRQFSEHSVWPGDTSLICQDIFRAGGFIPATVIKSYSFN